MTYNQIHIWVNNVLGIPHVCGVNINHKSKRYEWANISRKYLVDAKDWFPLCRSCHKIFDTNKIETIKELKEVVNSRSIKQPPRFYKRRRTLIKKKRHTLSFYFPNL